MIDCLFVNNAPYQPSRRTDTRTDDNGDSTMSADGIEYSKMDTDEDLASFLTDYLNAMVDELPSKDELHRSIRSAGTDEDSDTTTPRALPTLRHLQTLIIQDQTLMHNTTA